MISAHRISAALVSGLPALTACASPSPAPAPVLGAPFEVQRFGTLREVLRDGHTEGRVGLADLDLSEHAVGIGVVEGLAGEIAFAGGELWVSRVEDGELVTLREPGALRAAFLVAARSESWAGIEWWHGLDVTRLATLGELEQTLGALGVDLAPAGTWPFLAVAHLLELEGHVLRGGCPYAPEPLLPGQEPLTVERYDEVALLVGFYSIEAPGVIAHHGSRLHVHAVLGAGAGPVVHVDDARLASWAILYTPWPATEPAEETK